MAPVNRPPAPPTPARSRSLWLAYAGLCLLCWTLYSVAGTDWQHGSLHVWDAMYEATWNLGPPMLLGALVLPWTRWLQRSSPPWPARVALHASAALLFAALWHALDFGLAWWFFGPEHANATLQQQLLWRNSWALLVYMAIYLGFNGALHARRARDAAVATAQAESALVRAELAVVAGKLNPHFFFNTLNSIHFLMRRDTQAAEQALLGFARMMRYLLDSRRGAADRVPLREELDFVRDYLALESLRLGPRLKVEWTIAETTLDDEVPPLTLQPLVENAILHGIAPRVEGGTVSIASQRAAPVNGQQPDSPTLALRVADDGAGCVWPPTEPRSSSRGVGLHSLQRRFELDYDGRAKLQVRSAPGAGFSVDILIPQPDLQA